MKLYLLLSLSLVCLGLHAQDYLVTSRNDTLRGELSIMSLEKFDKVTLTVDKKKTDHPAYAILLAYIDSARYIPVRTVDAFRMMKAYKSGMVSLCYARQSSGRPYDIPYLVKKSGGTLEISAIRFKANVSKFLAECSSLRNSIEEGKLGRNDLEKIVDTYNSCLEQQSTVAFSVTTEDPKLAALNSFHNRLSSDSAVPEDAKEILKDLYMKVKDNKPVPTYLSEALRQAFKDLPNYHEDVEKLIAVLKN